MTNDRKCRWGILGSAGIAQKNWQALAYAGNSELVAVASRNQAKAGNLSNAGARFLGTDPEAVGGYEQLLARDDVDAIYLPLPTGLQRSGP